MTDTNDTTPRREITDHKGAPDMNESLTVTAIGERNAGGTNTEYVIGGFSYPIDVVVNTDTGATEPLDSDCVLLKFQDGNPAQGINGITNETLLAIVIDRLRSFQGGAFPCRENALALTHAQESLMWLQQRSRAQVAQAQQT